MSCPHFEGRLNDYAGGYLSGRARQEVDEHLLICTTCRDELKALRELVEDLSSLPRSIEAPGEVWSATKAELRGRDPVKDTPADLPEPNQGDPVKRGHPSTPARDRANSGESGCAAIEAVAPRGPGGSLASPSWFLRPMPLAAAASILLIVAVAAVVGLRQVGLPSDPAVVEGRDVTPGQTGGGAEVTGASGPGSAGAVRVAPAGLDPLDLESTEAEFSRAAENLLAALQAQRDRIPPETLALIEENLIAIDGAISDTHRAMESDPGNARLGRLMRAMYHRKMRLLQGAAVIPSS